MDTRLKKYSRTNAAKIAAYAVVIGCLCLVAGLLGDYMYTNNSGLEALVKEEYYNSNAYNNEVAQALADTGEIFFDFKDTAAPSREYFYYACHEGSGSVSTNFAAEEAQGFSGYKYGYQIDIEYAHRLDNGVEQPLPQKDMGVLAVISGQLPKNLAHYPITDMYIIFTDELLAERQRNWEAERGELLHIAARLLVILLVIVPLLVYLGLVTGRSPLDEDLRTGLLDKLHSEVLMLTLLLTVLGGSSVWLFSMETVYAPMRYGQATVPLETQQLVTIASVVYVGILTCLALLQLNALIRKFKARAVLRHSLLWKLLGLLRQPLLHLTEGLRNAAGHIIKWAAATWRLLFVGPEYGGSDPAERLFRRQRRFLLNTAVAVGSMIFFLLLEMKILFLLCLLAQAVFVYYFLRHNRRDMAEVRWSVEHSLTEQIKSEKLKVDLVTNVSHDLKTPLTSIISYVELLSLEQDLGPVARDYVQVLGEKSQRLNRIVSDLFDLAKATSGNIPLDIELLDLKRLFAQTLAEMGDSIEASGLQMRLRLTEQPLLVLADGGRLYRVLQNVLDNALKYSNPDSRVYVELYENQGHAIGEVKNTASYEMTFTAEDIMRRFARGDIARSSEGSGLGLAIAKSFCEACGGDFSIAVDGDQFKAIIDFPLAGREE